MKAINNEVTYSMVLEHFGEEKINDRYNFVFSKLEQYIESKKLSDNVRIDKSLLQQVIRDYFTDIYRLKVFHNIVRVNITKIIAYEMYWFLKRKPLQIINSDKDLPFVNENFATIFIAHEFLYKNNEFMTDSGEDKLMAFLDHLSYHFKYRTVDKQNIELMLFAFETGKQVYQNTIENNEIEI